MAVDLADLIPSLEREVSPPGTDLFPTATDDEWLGQLQDSFWEAKIYGFFDDYSESDGLVSPISGIVEFPRDQQQLVVLFAGLRSLRSQLVNTNTSFRAAAGPVEFETANSATLLRDLFKSLEDKLNAILGTMSDLSTSQDYYFNALFERSDSLVYGNEAWWG